MSRKDYIIKNANEFSPEERARFKQIVLSKGEVLEQTFDQLMSKNPVLIFFPNSEKPQGIGALKIPNKQYKKKVFQNSQTQFKADDFEYELGWVVSLKQGEGIGKFITHLLFNFKQKIYATVRTENVAMNKIMHSIGFELTGSEYRSDRGNYTNCLYIKRE